MSAPFADVSDRRNRYGFDRHGSRHLEVSRLVRQFGVSNAQQGGWPGPAPLFQIRRTLERMDNSDTSLCTSGCVFACKPHSSRGVAQALPTDKPPFETIVVDRSSPEYLAINPLVTVPALVADYGWLTVESFAVLLHIAASFPRRGLRRPLRASCATGSIGICRSW